MRRDRHEARAAANTGIAEAAQERAAEARAAAEAAQERGWR